MFLPIVLLWIYNITFMVHSFSVLEQGLLTYRSFSFPSISPCGLLGQQNPLFGRICCLSLDPVEIRGSSCISKSQRGLCVSFSRTDYRLCIYRLFVRSNLNFLHNSQWIIFSTIVVTSLLLIISSLSPHNLHLLFYCLYYYYYYSLRVFHINVRWWSFTEVWMTASLLKSPGLFSVFWPISNSPVPLVTVPKAPIRIGIIVTFMFYCFFSIL